MIKKGFLLCASEEFCGGIEEICRNKTYICANDKVPWSQLQCIASLAVVTVSHKQKSAAVALLWVKCQGGIPITPADEQLTNKTWVYKCPFWKNSGSLNGTSDWSYIAQHYLLSSNNNPSLPQNYLLRHLLAEMIIILELSQLLTERRIFHCVLCWGGGHMNKRVSQRKLGGSCCDYFAGRGPILLLG